MSKKTFILGGILIILIALAFIYQGLLKNWQANLGKTKSFLADVKIEQINKIEITSAGKTVDLDKQGDPSAGSGQVKWKIGGTKDFYADTKQVSLALNNLDQAIKADLELISDKQERKKEFNADSSGIEVKLFEDSKKVSDFVIGKLAYDFSSTYMATSDKPSTYLVKVNLYSAFNQTDWRDLTIFSSTKEKITKIRMQYPDREFTVEKKDNTWQGVLPTGFKIDQTKIDKILTIMSDLIATAIPEQTFNNTGLDKHLIVIEASGEGIDNVLMVGSADKNNQYYAKKGDSDNIYLITKEQRDELNKWIWQLK